MSVRAASAAPVRPAGQRAAQQFAALHGVVSIRGLRAGGDGGVFPGSRSKPQKGTGNPKTVRDPLHRVEAGHRSVTSGHFADPLGFHSAIRLKLTRAPLAMEKMTEKSRIFRARRNAGSASSRRGSCAGDGGRSTVSPAAVR